MQLLRRMPRISWTRKNNQSNLFREADTTRSYIKRIRKRQETFLGRVMRREKVEHLLTTEMIEGKRSRENSEKRC